MAGSKEALSKFEEQITCPVCLDTFTDPKQLQCHHVYCRSCLAKLVERDQQGQLVLSCPNCRQITPVPVNGVAGIQPAFQTNNLLEYKSTLKKALSQGTEDSSLESVEAVDSAASPTVPPPSLSKVISYCPEHPGEEIKLYCEDCTKFTCFKCVLSGAEHHSHSYKVLDAYREDILSSLEPVRDQLSITSNAAKQINTQCAEIRDQQVEIDARLDQTIGQLHEMLDLRKAELKSRLRHLADNKVQILKSQKEQIMKTRAQLEQCECDVHEKLQQLKDDREIVAMKQSMTAQISELTSAFQPEAMNPVSAADIALSVPDNLPDLCQNYGTITSKELQPDPSQCSVMDTAHLESAEVGSKVEINIKAIDHFGNPCLDTLPPLEFGLMSEIGDSELGQCEGSHSHYTVSFTPAIKGQHQLRAIINGQHVSGSPFAVHVRSSVENLGDQIFMIEGVKKPWGIVVNKKREIIVSESSKHRISVYSTRGKKLRSFGSQGSGNREFKSPRGLALDDFGNIVVADHDNHRIQMLTDDGEFLKAVGAKSSGPLQFNGPTAIAFNAFNQQFYVADSDGYVHILSSQLECCGRFGGRSKSKFMNLIPSEACGISCDSSGDVYFADTIRSKVQVFTAEGVLSREFSKFPSGKIGPACITVDSNNFVYISSYWGGFVSVCNAEGEPVKNVTVGGTLYDIAVDDYGIVYICDYNNGHIYMH